MSTLELQFVGYHRISNLAFAFRVVLSVLAFVGLVGGVPKLIDALAPPEYKVLVFCLSTTSLLLVFVGTFFGVSIYRWFRDEPLDGFDIKTANALKEIAALSLVNYDAKRRNKAVMSAGLAVKYTTLELVILRLSHLMNNVVPVLLSELRRERATQNPKGFKRIGESAVLTHCELELLRDELSEWLRLVDPLLATPLSSKLERFSSWLHHNGETLLEWGSLTQPTFNKRRNQILEMLQEIMKETTSLQGDIETVADALQLDLTGCRSLVTAL
ncbi:MAG: hypothetical protein ACI8P0_003218 [Planctomycetaceae bacterium]|jgi:hypothetical protein